MASWERPFSTNTPKPTPTVTPTVVPVPYTFTGYVYEEELGQSPSLSSDPIPLKGVVVQLYTGRGDDWTSSISCRSRSRAAGEP